MRQREQRYGDLTTVSGLPKSCHARVPQGVGQPQPTQQWAVGLLHFSLQLLCQGFWFT